MSQLQVKKVVAVCFLEAAKLTLEHVGAHRLELAQQGNEGRDGAAELPRIYGEVCATTCSAASAPTRSRCRST
jgi:hypothetical protein